MSWLNNVHYYHRGLLISLYVVCHGFHDSSVCMGMQCKNIKIFYLCQGKRYLHSLKWAYWSHTVFSLGTHISC